jgi:CRISPR system Cascade subunit CasE
MSEEPLHLLYTRPDARLLAAWMARHLGSRERETSDMGDALHGLLRAAFGDSAPQPFRYLEERQELLAYTSLNAEAMRAQVALADPVAAMTLGLDANAHHAGYRLRVFPTTWPVGQVLGFEVRLRPTVRTAKGERDAFLHAVDLASETHVNRQAVYVKWLREHLSRREGVLHEPWQGAVELLDDVHLAGYQRRRIVRRTQAEAGEIRRGRVIDGPDCLLRGHLRVVNPAAFARLLARGVGRHRAFGFGMLLLSRAV